MITKRDKSSVNIQFKFYRAMPLLLARTTRWPKVTGSASQEGPKNIMKKKTEFCGKNNAPANRRKGPPSKAVFHSVGKFSTKSWRRRDKYLIVPCLFSTSLHWHKRDWNPIYGKCMESLWKAESSLAFREHSSRGIVLTCESPCQGLEMGMGEWGRSKSRGVAWMSCVINAAMATSKLGWQGQGSQGGEGAAGGQRRERGQFLSRQCVDAFVWWMSSARLQASSGGWKPRDLAALQPLPGASKEESWRECGNVIWGHKPLGRDGVQCALGLAGLTKESEEQIFFSMTLSQYSNSLGQ